MSAVETIDFMTACWACLDHDFLDHVSRVVYDISGAPPATIEWE